MNTNKPRPRWVGIAVIVAYMAAVATLTYLLFRVVVLDRDGDALAEPGVCQGWECADGQPVLVFPTLETVSPAAPEPTVEPEPYVEAEPYIEPAPRPEPGTVTLWPTTYTSQDQGVVDTGALVTWFDGSGGLPCMLAGHDNLGWYWIDDLAPGTHVTVGQGACAGEWVVVENRWDYKSEGAYGWMWDYSSYLLLQTCEAGGYGYSIARPA